MLGESHRDDIAQTTAVATVLRRLAPDAATHRRTLSVLPLRGDGRALRNAFGTGDDPFARPGPGGPTGSRADGSARPDPDPAARPCSR